MSTGTIRRRSTAINRGVASGVRESNFLLSQARAGPTPTPSSSNFSVIPDNANGILISKGTTTASAKTDSKLTWTGTGLNIEGDLLVTGSTNTSTSDTLIELNKGHTGTNNNDLGIIMERGTSGDNAFMGWDESTSRFSLATTDADGTSPGNLTLTPSSLQISTLHGTGIISEAATGLNIQFLGNTALNKITLNDNLVDALNITEANDDSYLKFVTKTGEKQIVFGKKSTFSDQQIADLGTVLAATSITSTAFVGTLTGNSLGIHTGDLTGNVTGDLTGDVTGDVTGAVTGNVTGDLTGNVTGDLTGDVTGAVTGNVTGDLTGNVTGDVTGDVTGAVTGNVTGDLTGNVTGDLTGDVTGAVTGNVTGDLTGNVTGDLTGDVTGAVTGNVTGNVTGDLTGNVTGDLTGAVTIDTTITSGNAVASYGIGLKNSVSTSVAYSAANDIRSGAIHVPAGSLITDIHVIVSAELTHGNGTTGVKAGIAADGAQIVAADVDAIQATASTTTAVGLGSSTNSATTAALQGNAALLIVAGQAYRSANTEVHITVDNSTGNMSAGTVKFVVEYVKLA